MDRQRSLGVLGLPFVMSLLLGLTNCDVTQTHTGREGISGGAAGESGQGGTTGHDPLTASGQGGSGTSGRVFPASTGDSSGNTTGGTGGTGGDASGGTGGDETGGTGGDATAGAAGSSDGEEECTEETTRSCAAEPFNKQGACSEGVATCVDGSWVGCADSLGDDTCEPGNDDSCNGTPNEGCACVDGDTQDCGHAAVGNCSPGKSTCLDSTWGDCVGNVDPGPRDCTSSADNDCDGTPDNTIDDVCQCPEDGAEQSCDDHPGLDGNGRCQAGTQTCVMAVDNGSSLWEACEGSVGPASADTCTYGNDDNCNGDPNEGCRCVDGETQICGHAEVGICQPGTSTCQDTIWGDCVGNVDPLPRDCTSSADNDCDGSPDNATDSVCNCVGGSSRNCGTHPGLDGNGPCKAGTQSCLLAADNTSSDWAATCTGSVGPAGPDNCEPENDNNCNGNLNEGCACVNGEPISCACGPDATCINGTPSACAQSEVTRYEDGDGDSYGKPGTPTVVCPGTPGYVNNTDDCDDGNPLSIPGTFECSSDTQLRWCLVGGGGAWQSMGCTDGCINGACRTDGTIGLPGFVSCSQTAPITRCATSVGCDAGYTDCETAASPGSVQCDGQNDCPGQVCCAQGTRGGTFGQCHDGACPSGWELVCDPLDDECPNCSKFGVNDGVSFYVCR